MARLVPGFWPAWSRIPRHRELMIARLRGAAVGLFLALVLDSASKTQAPADDALPFTEVFASAEQCRDGNLAPAGCQETSR